MDLFEKYEELPKEVLDIIEEFSEKENDYKVCEDLKNRLKLVGYTCEYDLSATPYNLKVLDCPVCKSKNTRDDYDFPDTINCCEVCGTDFLNDGEIILNPHSDVA
jgi:hypothetical protein